MRCAAGGGHAGGGDGDGSEARGSAWRWRRQRGARQRLEAADSGADLGSSAGRERMGWPGGGKKHMVGPIFFWRGSRGPPEMEAWRGNLEGYAKWRLV
jgi:hypothetical protein